LNDGSGTIAIDDTQYLNNGILLPSDTLPIWEINLRSDTIWVGYGSKNYFLEFNGTNNYIDCGNQVNPRDKLTVMAWVRPDVVDINSQVILSKFENSKYQWKLGINSNAETEFVIYENQSSSTIAATGYLQKGKWNMVTGVYDGQNLAVYVNEVASYPFPSATFPIQDVDANIRVGNDPVNNYFFDGKIDEVRIWDRALTVQEISNIYNLQKDKYEDPCYEVISLSDGVSTRWTIKRSLSEASQMVELLFRKVFLTKFEILRKTDKAFTYVTYGGLSFDIKIFRSNEELDVDQGEILSFTATKRINTEVGEFEILMDNDPKKDYRTGDAIEIWWTTGSALSKVFSGEIDEVEEGQEEDRVLILRGKDWGKLLLEQKIPAGIEAPSSYPIATNVKTIILDIMEYSGLSSTIDVGPNDRLINVSYIYDYTATRTIDFVGESIFDCLLKLAEITQSDFYVDANKRLQFQPRGSRLSEVTLYGGGAGGTLNPDSIEDYFYDLKKDAIINSVKCYGSPTKPDPLDLDSTWTEGITSWSAADWTGTALSADTSKAKAGTTSVKLTGTGASGTITVGAEVDFGTNYDLTRKESFTNLKWANRIFCAGINPYLTDVIIYLKDEDGRGLQYKYKTRPELDKATDQIHFPEQEVPVGPFHETDGEWEEAQNVIYNVTRSDTLAIESPYIGSWAGGEYYTVGSTPWLIENDGNYIRLGALETNGYHNRMGTWNFGDIGSTLQTWNIISINLHIWSRYYSSSGGQIYVYFQLPGINYYQNNARTVESYTTPHPDPIPFEHYPNYIAPLLNSNDDDSSYVGVKVTRNVDQALQVTPPTTRYDGSWIIYPSDWEPFETITYPNSDDGDGSYVENWEIGSMIGEFEFQNFTGSVTGLNLKSVKLYINGRQVESYPGVNTKVRFYIWDGSSWRNAGDREFTSTSYSWTSFELYPSIIDTIEKANGAKLRFEIISNTKFLGITWGKVRITGAALQLQYDLSPQGFEDYTWTFQDMQSEYISTPLLAVRLALKAKNIIAYGTGDSVTIGIYLDIGSGYQNAGTLEWLETENSYSTKYLDVSSIVTNITEFNNCKLKIKCNYINPGSTDSSDLRMTYCYLEADGYGTLAFSPGYYTETNASFTEHIYSITSLTTFALINGAKLILRGKGSAGQSTEITKVSLEVNLSKDFGFLFNDDGNPFEWDHVRRAAFLFKVNRTDTSNIEVNIDWLHWDEGKYYGEYEDIPTGEDLKFIEVFDETIFSDTAAETRARSKVLTYRDSIPLTENAQLDLMGSETLDIGLSITFTLPENTFSPRIKEMRYQFYEGDMDQYITAWERG